MFERRETFRRNYETKKYSREAPEINPVPEKYDPSAEFRIVRADNTDELIESSEFKVITKKRKLLFRNVNEQVVIDEYADFLESKTKLISALTDRAFLCFDDLLNFLESKNIKIKNSLPADAKMKFRTREEFPVLIDYQSATELLSQLENLKFTDEDLRRADSDKLHLIIDGLFEKQRQEIVDFIRALKEVKNDTALFIRISD